MKICDESESPRAYQLRKRTAPRENSRNKRITGGDKMKKICDESGSPRAYQLRDIPEKLWDRVKHKAIDEKRSIRELILDRLEKTC